MPGAGDQDHLRSIQLLTDTALSRLDVEAVLLQLLDRVRDTLQADTAAVLLLESGTQELVAGRRGIEEEVYQNVRVPLRTGFAGRIAAERRPVLLARVDETTVTNPILWEKGIRTMLGVPLLVSDRLNGVLHVGRLSERPFTDSDAQLLKLVAERVAFATQTGLLEVERTAARLLERSLLPRALPSAPDSRWLPATSPRKATMWAGTGTTSSYFPRANYGPLPATWLDMASRPRW